MKSQPGELVVVKLLLEAAREIGVLLIAFAPLDFAVSSGPARQYWFFLLGFLVAGVLLLSIGVAGEWRLGRWQGS